MEASTDTKYVIFDNKTFERAADGCYYLKANNAFAVIPCTFPFSSTVKMSEKSEKIAANGEMENLKIDAQVYGKNQVNSASNHVGGMSTPNIEPIIIDNYNSMNYFSQAASNVTIYLNENNFITNKDCVSSDQVYADGKNCYFIDPNGVIDLTKPPKTPETDKASIEGSYKNLNENSAPFNVISVECLQENDLDFPYVNTSAAPVGKIELNEGLEYLNILQAKEETDAPEFIDISRLDIPPIYRDCFLYPSNVKPPRRNNPVPPFLKRNRQSKPKPSTVTASTSTDESRVAESDDEVIFVKEYQAENDESSEAVKTCKSESEDPLDLSSCVSDNSAKAGQLEPRRNPKRQVQLLKASYDLALKLSDADIYYGRIRSSFKEYYTENSRRSSRNTGAVLSPPSALTNEDYKEWPVEGMHERPIFNSNTKKIDKFDYRKVPKSKPIPKSKDLAKPIQKKRKIVKKMQKKKLVKTCDNQKGKVRKAEVNKEFAALTHDTFQHVMDYFLQVKEYNEIIDSRNTNSEVVKDDDMSEPNARFARVKEMLEKRHSESNLTDAAELLADSCILYSLANNVCQDSVATYLNNFKDENEK